MLSNLIIHNIVVILSIISSVSIGVYVLFKDPRKILNVTFFASTLSVALFYIGHFLGTNADSIESAFRAYSTNSVNIAIIMFNAHMVFSLLGTAGKHYKWLIGNYIVGIALMVFFAIKPELLVAQPEPKMYFDYYYAPGPLYWLMRVYIVVIPVHFFFYLIKGFINSKGIERIRMKYFLYGHIVGYAIGTTAVLPIYGIDFDPAISMLFGFYTLFFAYAIVRYSLLDIRIVARRTVVVIVSITLVSLFLVAFNYSSNLVEELFPTFPTWFIPVLSGLIFISIGYLALSHFREMEKLKYEFINVVTHKFRTPLTYIKWSSDTSSEITDEKELRDRMQKIKESNNKLIELTNTLIEATNAESGSYSYSFEALSPKILWEEIVKEFGQTAKEKNIDISIDLDDSLSIEADKKRIKSVFQFLLDNAIMYTPDGGSIKIKGKTDNRYIIISVTDTGIGISKIDRKRLFTRFFRADNAKHKYTEGTGIGLYISKEIIRHHGGKIWVESPGIGKGSTFYLKLPRA